MDCLVLPVSFIRNRCRCSRSGYQALTDDESDDLVTVIVGREKRVFLVDPFVLEENPFRVLIQMMKRDRGGKENRRVRGEKQVIFVDVDAILFEHMLWLMNNDCASLLKLNLKDIIDFYAQDN